MKNNTVKLEDLEVGTIYKDNKWSLLQPFL